MISDEQLQRVGLSRTKVLAVRFGASRMTRRDHAGNCADAQVESVPGVQDDWLLFVAWIQQ